MSKGGPCSGSLGEGFQSPLCLCTSDAFPLDLPLAGFILSQGPSLGGLFLLDCLHEFLFIVLDLLQSLFLGGIKSSRGQFTTGNIAGTEFMAGWLKRCVRGYVVDELLFGRNGGAPGGGPRS